MTSHIHDHGHADALDFDLTGFEALAAGIRKHTRSGGGMQQSVIDFEQARQERDAGMQLAVQNAVAADDSWPDAAYGFLCRYARTHAEFISEECTAMADRMGYAAPTSSKAWGAIFAKAARESVILRVGYGVSQRRHLSPTPLWRSLVFVGSAA